MTAAPVPAAPSMFAVFRKRDFSLLWLAQLISTAGSALTDLAAGIYVYPRDELRARRRADADGHGHPEPHRRAARRRVRRPPRPQEDPDVDVPDPVGHRRPARGGHRHGCDRHPGPVRACCCSTPASSSSSTRPTTASSRRWPATRSWRPPTRSCRSPRSARPRSASPGRASSPSIDLRLGVRHRCVLVHRVCRPDLPDGPLPDAETRRRRERRGHRGQPEVGPRDAVRHAGPPLAVPGRRLHVLLVRAVERAAPAVLAARAGCHGVRVRPAGGADLGRLRHRLVLHGPVLEQAAREPLWIVARPRRDGHLRASPTPARTRSRWRSCS